MPLKTPLLAAAMVAGLVAGCQRPQEPAKPQTTTPQTSKPRATQSPVPVENSLPSARPIPQRSALAQSAPPLAIIITSPKPHASIGSNPFTVEGSARTFESQLLIRIRDKEGRVIETIPTTAQGPMGEYAPFRSELFLTSWPGEHFSLEAFEASPKDGSEQSLVSIPVTLTVPRAEVQLYFHDPARAPKDCSRVFATTRSLPLSIAPAQLVIKALLAGPTESEKRTGLASPFPPDASLRSVNIRLGVATVDFNTGMRNVGGACRAQAIQSMVEKTLQQFPGVQRVRITAGGSEKLALQP